MNRVRLGLNLTLRSPFLFPGLDVGRFGLDAMALRDSQGRPVIPQDQIRGVLRHGMLDAAAAGAAFTEDDVATLFGSPSGDAAVDEEASFEPARGRLLFDDLSSNDPISSGQSVRVRIDPETGAADPGSLVFVELAAAPGADVRFRGGATLFADDALAQKALVALRIASTWVSAMGAMKSAGFGEVRSLSIEEASRTPLASEVPDNVEDRCAWLVLIDRPFLVDARRAADNVYLGSETIPGSVLKGALARKMALMGHDPAQDDALSALSFSHAVAENAGPPMPLSVVAADGAAGTVVGDALGVPRGRGAVIGDEPAVFRPDWKQRHHEAAQRALECPVTSPLSREVRTHVAIDGDKRVARDQQLFVTSAVDPGDRRWRVDVDFSRVPQAERPRFAAALASGLDGIGRTGASLRFKRTDPALVPPVRSVAWRQDAFALVLESDAVLVSPDDDTDAFDAYSAYWKRVCPGATLENFFASQRLAGGYLGRRFRNGGHYRPFWLTEAGSVFLLSGSISDRLSELVRNRLPAPVIGGGTTSWRNCPFQPENGYGAIRVDYNAALAPGVRHV